MNAAVLPESTEDLLRDELLAAAVEIFTAKGFEKAGVAAIARRAGVTTGAIYSRWTGKQELMLDALDLVMLDQLEQVLSSDGQTDEILSALGTDLVVRSATADALIAEAIVIARRDPAFHAMLSRRIMEQETRLAVVIDNGKAAGVVDPELATDALVALCQAISIGFAMFSSIDRALPAAEGWNAVIERLVAAAMPSAVSAPTTQSIPTQSSTTQSSPKSLNEPEEP